MAVGIRPYSEVAKDAGLDVERGIVVNDYYKRLTLIFML